jgi:hypothetical protein
MPNLPWIRLTELLVTAALCLAFFVAWRNERDDRAKLAVELATAQQTLSQADSRQHDRDSQLLQTLTTLAADKRNVTTSQQILRALFQQIPLPSPITLSASPNVKQPSSPQPNEAATSGHNSSASSLPDAPTSGSGNITSNPSSGNIISPTATIPAEDLKPLYDFAVDCRACQAKLAATQADLADERTKTATLTKERDAAVRTAKGGSALHRIALAAKWFAIGAAAGSLAALARH